jgi:hypothetical protein
MCARLFVGGLYHTLTKLAIILWQRNLQQVILVQTNFIRRIDPLQRRLAHLLGLGRAVKERVASLLCFPLCHRVFGVN